MLVLMILGNYQHSVGIAFCGIRSVPGSKVKVGIYHKRILLTCNEGKVLERPDN
jgi:hypothetical protein